MMTRAGPLRVGQSVQTPRPFTFWNADNTPRRIFRRGKRGVVLRALGKQGHRAASYEIELAPGFRCLVYKAEIIPL